ncbi:MAG: YciI family protein [Microcella sp.]|uniref:YciI family protein n=1 Tax=Microcella sp. TaxID=1913979 RepID=UPI003314F2DF
MILIHTDENGDGPQPGSDEFNEMLALYGQYNQKLMDGGHWIAGASLQPTATATTVHVTAGGAAPRIVDGPYAETKEQLGGYYVIRAEDLDEALQLAGEIPAGDAAIEVRPLSFRPDAHLG